MNCLIPPNIDYFKKSWIHEASDLFFLPARTLLGGREVVAVIHSDIKGETFNHTFRFVERKTQSKGWICTLLMIVCVVPSTLCGFALKAIAEYRNEDFAFVKREFAKWKATEQLPVVLMHPLRLDLVRPLERPLDHQGIPLEVDGCNHTREMGDCYFAGPVEHCINYPPGSRPKKVIQTHVEEPLHLFVVRPMIGDGNYVWGLESSFYGDAAFDFFKNKGQEKTVVFAGPSSPNFENISKIYQSFTALRKNQANLLVATSLEYWH